MNGYIKLHRKLLDWRWFANDHVLLIWIYILLNASYEDNWVNGVLLRKGQLMTGRKRIARDLNIGEQVVRTALNKLKSTNEITIESTNQYSIITVNKWEEYQLEYCEPTSEATNSLTIDQPSTNHRLTTTKEGKEGKEIKHIYGEYRHVRLTDKEYEKLTNDFPGMIIDGWIKKLDEGIELKGYKYKNHYLALRNWILREYDKIEKEIQPVYSAVNNPDYDEERFNELMKRRKS